MAEQSLRDALRLHTRQLHEAVDDAVGAFGNLQEYKDYLVRSYRFRLALELGLPQLAEWSVPSLSPLIRQDLDDLSVGPIQPPAAASISGGHSGTLGAIYVLEGSAIGARLLFRRARQLDLHGDFGARHMAVQAEDGGRWPRFLHLLETSATNRQAAIIAALEVFRLALATYSEPLHERS